MLVGIGTDGVSANIAATGLKGLVGKKAHWLYWTWCLAHHVELAIKDALKTTSYSLIDVILLHLCYIYEKSLKCVIKWRKLSPFLHNLLILTMMGLSQFMYVVLAGYHMNYQL